MLDLLLLDLDLEDFEEFLGGLSVFGLVLLLPYENTGRVGFRVGDGPGMSEDCCGESVGKSVGVSVTGAAVGVSVTGAAVTGAAVGVIVGTSDSLGDDEGVSVGSSDFGGIVGDPSGNAGQNAGHAPPRSGS